MDTAPDFIPDDQMPAEPPKSEAPDFIPDEKMPPAQEASAHAPDFIPDRDMPEEKDYSTKGQQVETGFESFARGLTGGLSDALASSMRNVASGLGVSDENLHYIAPAPSEMAQRQKENPGISLGSEIAGSAGLLSKLPQMGGRLLNGAIKGAIIAGGDELSKSILGDGDPLPAAAAHIAGSTGLNMLTEGLFSKAEKTLPKIVEKYKVGTKLNSFLSGFGHAAMFPEKDVVPLVKSALTPEEYGKLNDTAFKMGQHLYHKIGTGSAAIAGYLAGGLPAVGESYLAEKAIAKILEPVLSKVSTKYVAPVVMKISESGQMQHLAEALDNAEIMAKGMKKITNSVDNIFNPLQSKAIETFTSDKELEKLKEQVDQNSLDQEIQTGTPAEGYAQGGEVAAPQNAMADIWPQQNILLSATKNRVINHLKSKKPQASLNKLPYDSHHKDKRQERDYDKLLKLANQPLSILNHVKDGSLTAGQMHDFTAMYPDLHQYLSKKMTEKITGHQLDGGKKPPYKTRQALSVFLGSNLDSSLTPFSIQTIQGMFNQQKVARAQKSPSLNSLSKTGKNSLTPGQAREERQTKL